MDTPSERPAEHWASVYRARAPDSLSWYEQVPRVSLELIDALDIPTSAAVLDVGGGTSFLADHLVARGFSDVTVLDISAAALEEGRRRLSDDAVQRLHADVLDWHPSRRYDLWHDRALFHFLVAEEDRACYLRTLAAALPPGGAVILATFAPDAPERCSGLPVARYSAKELGAQLGDSFEPVEIRREEHTTPRGVSQPFTWLAGRVRA